SEFIYLIVPYPSPFAPADNPYAYYDMDMIFTLDASYYYLVSFLLILVAGWLVSRFISDFLLSFTENLPVPKPLDGVFGAITGFITHYLAIFLIIFTLSTIPFDWVQNTLSKSWLADSMLTSTPFLSENAYQYFIADVHEEEVEQLPTMDLEDLKEKTDSEEENEEE
ncbi:MAG: CvpA family protein, partial [Atopostipes sp.]|nr:CvpA family protein [Atopostipes sp.]